jgi:hypothetical protein
MTVGQWHLAACPVCRGDLQDEPEELGWATCLMCGRSFAIDDLNAITKKPEPNESTAPVRISSSGPSKAA